MKRGAGPKDRGSASEHFTCPGTACFGSAKRLFHNLFIRWVMSFAANVGTCSRRRSTSAGRSKDVRKGDRMPIGRDEMLWPKSEPVAVTRTAPTHGHRLTADENLCAWTLVLVAVALPEMIQQAFHHRSPSGKDFQRTGEKRKPTGNPHRKQCAPAPIPAVQRGGDPPVCWVILKYRLGNGSRLSAA